jgi:hypothetical protein
MPASDNLIACWSAKKCQRARGVGSYELETCVMWIWKNVGCGRRPVES